MTIFREILSHYGFIVDSKPLEKADKKAKDFDKTLKDLITTLSGAYVVSTIRNFIDSSARIGDELDKTSQQLGLTVRQLQGLRHAAELAGVDNTAFTQSLSHLQQKALEAATGSAEAARIFRRLGIDVRDSNGQIKNADVLIREVATGLQGMSNSTERVGISQQLMGETGRRLLPMLTGGAEAINASAAELDNLGGATQEYVNTSVALTDAKTRWRQVTLGLRSALATAFFPIITKVIMIMTKLGGVLNKMSGFSGYLKIVFTGLGIAATIAARKVIIAWLAAAWPFVLLVAAIGVVSLFIQDLIVMFKGGRSVIGEFFGEIAEWLSGGRIGAAQFANNIGEAIDFVISKFNHLMETIGARGLMSTLWNIRDVLSETGAMRAPETAGRTGGRTTETPPARPAIIRTAETLPTRETIRVTAGVRRVQEEAQRQRRTAGFRPAGPQVAGIGVSPMLPARPAPVSIQVTAPATQSITVNEATDANVTRQMIATELEANNRRQRQMIAEQLVDSRRIEAEQ